ncbi:hypothetical protein OSB04_015689 [Centaurea solstitialis]|uniref:F-box domain-containing protein n=1 Tax=Centaurea solstitialis TaxID=347529 RepID=A0AA38WJ01_9ASTR|nr:hypothetical protein OSB04_015689 [Centaurea solstitialis]
MNSSVENLPSDVTVNILSRLPVKTIIHSSVYARSGISSPLEITRSGTPRILKWMEIEDGLDHRTLHQKHNKNTIYNVSKGVMVNFDGATLAPIIVHLPQIHLMENLPSEVMDDILSRLPVKTIIHCKCVCKKWHNLVKRSYFINLHFSRSPAGFMALHDEEIPDGDTSGMLKWVEIEDGLEHHFLHHDPVLNFDLNGYLPTPILGTEFLPLGSVNGLICIWHRGAGNIHICNPITREYLTLPRQPNYKNVLVVYKFGLNPLTGEYKVLRIFQEGQPGGHFSHLLQAEVYTIGTSGWRSIDNVPYQFGGLYSVFLNGYFHWKVYDLDAPPESILTFDLDKETFQIFPSPCSEPFAELFSNLGVFKGCLCKSYTKDSQFTIWVMKQHAIKESWHKELVITQAIFVGLNRGRIFVFGGLQDGTVLVVLDNKLVAYCPKSKTFDDLAILGRWSIVLTHHPSLIKLLDIDSERPDLEQTLGWRSTKIQQWRFGVLRGGEDEAIGNLHPLN